MRVMATNLASRRGFQGRTIYWNHSNLSKTNYCCHGNKNLGNFVTKIGFI